MFGLSEKDIDMVLEAVQKFPEIEDVIIFGSRALGNYKKGSDVDMAIKGTSITIHTVLGLSDLLNEVYPLPYYFDIVHYETISNSNLIKHIKAHGIQLTSGCPSPATGPHASGNTTLGR